MKSCKRPIEFDCITSTLTTKQLYYIADTKGGKKRINNLGMVLMLHICFYMSDLCLGCHSEQRYC